MNESSDEETSIAPFAETPYEVSDNDELRGALQDIANSADTEATIVLTADVTAPRTPDDFNITFFGASGKHITVKSAEGGMKKLSFASRCTLNGDCTFDNVDVTGGSLFCNGHQTIFTDKGQIHLKGTLYGGGYQTTVASTHVEIASSGSITPNPYISLHDVIGGSYQGNVTGDTYLEITGDIQMQDGSHLNPGCMKGYDGANVYVGGNATLIYDNKNADTSPAIEGTYGCEMNGDVTLDVRSGSVFSIVGTDSSSTSSIIRRDLHIKAGYPGYKKDTDPVLRLVGYYSIVGADNHTVGRNITIDTYENVWGWDKITGPDPDNPCQIYGALDGTVGGDIIINAQGSHLTNIYGAGDSTVQGSVSVNATDVKLATNNDPDFPEGDVAGLWTNPSSGTPCTAGGPVTVTVKDGDVGRVMVTAQAAAPADSSINVTGNPKIRSICGEQSSTSSANLPVANVYACEATIPLIKKMSQVNVTRNSKVTVHNMDNNDGLLAGLFVEEGSALTTDQEPISIQGNIVINGTWEQLYNQTNYGNPDIFVSGTTQIGPSGRLINHGTSKLKGTVTNNGMMALMKPSEFGGNYVGTNAELRLPAAVTNYTAADIPLKIGGLSTGTTTVNTVEPADWSTLKKPNLGDNYILSKKNTDSPAQDVFVLGNADAVKDDWFLKRMADADGTDDYYMWQVANSIRVVFDKNGGDTEADPRIMVQDKVVGAVNHFDLPTTEPTRSGCKFTGWNTQPDGTGEAFTAETDVTENLTVYAQWQPVSGTENGSNSGSNSGGNSGDNSGSSGSSSGNCSTPAAKAEQGSQPVSHAVSDAAASTGPKTGDASALSLWAAVMAVSILGLAGICMAAKIHHRSKK